MSCSKLTPMAKRCEFCKESKAVVFCKSDAAHLCLTCDAKVHSANALSYRHPRTLVCESCRNLPAFVRCFDHRTFMCQSCDITHHLSSDHHKKIVGCYVGCPSAKDLAELWGLVFGDDLVAGDSGAASALESGGGSSSRGRKDEKDEKQETSSGHLIMQQILDLKRLQLSESIDDSCLARVKERACGSPFRHDATWKEPRMLEREREEESLSSSPFSHMESFTSNGNGDSFWHCRSPLHDNEIWLQNMQDLGVCDEVQCFEDVNIPEVDPTFRSFEELFGNEEATSNEDRYPPFDRIEQIVDSNPDKAHQSVPPHPRTIKPSYSRSSLSASRVTDGGSGSHYKEKKPPRYEKQEQYTSSRTKSDFKKRGRNQSLKGEGFECECGSVNGSAFEALYMHSSFVVNMLKVPTEMRGFSRMLHDILFLFFNLFFHLYLHSILLFTKCLMILQSLCKIEAC